MATFKGALANLEVTLRGGDDLLVIADRSEADPHWPGCCCPQCTPLAIQGDLSITAGKGADVILLQNVAVDGNVRVETRHGADIAVLEAITVGGDLAMNTTYGHDAVLLRRLAVTGETAVTTGRGKDVLGMYDCYFSDDVFAGLGKANDEVSVEANTFDQALELRGRAGRNEMTEGLAGLNTLNGAFRHSRLHETLEHVADVHFEYKGEKGPAHWGDLTPAFLLTEVGRTRRRSPSTPLRWSRSICPTWRSTTRPRAICLSSTTAIRLR